MTTNSAVEFLVWMLIAASIIAVIASRLRIPYTVALVLGGLALGSGHVPIVETLIRVKPDWLNPGAALVIFLPPLLFEGSFKLQLRQLRHDALLILLLATVGVLAATLITGLAVRWILELPVLVALVFGTITAATDPISVLSIFKEVAAPKRLSVIVEGESLFNDGTAAVMFGILVAGVASGRLGILGGVWEFFVEVLGGTVVGLFLGFVFSKLTERINDPQIEITLTTVLAYTSYLVAQYLRLSGVIATVSAGLILGNFGARVGMSARTRLALWSFWEYFSFIINSLVFLLIGLEVRLDTLFHNWYATLLAILTVVLGRIVSVYALVPVSNLLSTRISLRWQHILVAGGIRGALALALALSLDRDFPYRQQLLAMTFGVVAFTIVVQGLAIRPLLRVLGITTFPEGDFRAARVRQISIASAHSELEALLNDHTISVPAYEQLRREVDMRASQVEAEVAGIYGKDKPRILSEIRMARAKLVAAEKTAIEQSVQNGMISPRSAADMIEDADRRWTLWEARISE